MHGRRRSSAIRPAFLPDPATRGGVDRLNKLVEMPRIGRPQRIPVKSFRNLGLMCATTKESRRFSDEKR